MDPARAEAAGDDGVGARQAGRRRRRWRAAGGPATLGEQRPRRRVLAAAGRRARRRRRRRRSRPRSAARAGASAAIAASRSSTAGSGSVSTTTSAAPSSAAASVSATTSATGWPDQTISSRASGSADAPGAARRSAGRRRSARRPRRARRAPRSRRSTMIRACASAASTRPGVQQPVDRHVRHVAGLAAHLGLAVAPAARGADQPARGVLEYFGHHCPMLRQRLLRLGQREHPRRLFDRCGFQQQLLGGQRSGSPATSSAARMRSTAVERTGAATSANASPPRRRVPSR